MAAPRLAHASRLLRPAAITNADMALFAVPALRGQCYAGQSATGNMSGPVDSERGCSDIAYNRLCPRLGFPSAHHRYTCPIIWSSVVAVIEFQCYSQRLSFRSGQSLTGTVPGSKKKF